MSATNEVEKHILNWGLRNIVPPVNGTVYIALFTADPGEDASYTNEVSGGGYARQAVTFSDPLLLGQTANIGIVQTDIATVDQGVVTHWAVVTELTGTGGLMIVRAALAVAENLVVGKRFTAAIGDLVVTHS